jgi:hypothetical protein
MPVMMQIHARMFAGKQSNVYSILVRCSRIHPANGWRPGLRAWSWTVALATVKIEVVRVLVFDATFRRRPAALGRGYGRIGRVIFGVFPVAAQRLICWNGIAGLPILEAMIAQELT